MELYKVILIFLGSKCFSRFNIPMSLIYCLQFYQHVFSSLGSHLL